MSIMSKAHQLHELLAEGSELDIVCHNNPDPDCLASVLALGRITAVAGIDERHILYRFVNLLDIDLNSLEPAALQDRIEGYVL